MVICVGLALNFEFGQKRKSACPFGPLLVPPPGFLVWLGFEKCLSPKVEGSPEGSFVMVLVNEIKRAPDGVDGGTRCRGWGWGARGKWGETGTGTGTGTETETGTRTRTRTGTKTKTETETETETKAKIREQASQNEKSAEGMLILLSIL